MEEKLHKKMRDRYKACMVLHGLGDTIGFKNGDWEFNYNETDVSAEYTNYIIYEFISLGGILDINLNGWIVSDDTVMHMATAQALLHKYKSIDELSNITLQKYHDSLMNMQGRAVGNKIKESLEIISRGLDWKSLPYDPMAGGSGASMRASCIGLAFHKKKDIHKLVAASIELSRITHNSAIGYLSGLTCALFTSYAINGYKIDSWPFKLIDLFKDDIIDNYMKKTRGYTEFERDKYNYVNYWFKYLELRFKGKSFNKEKTMEIPSFRSDFFMKYISKPNMLPGFMGHDSVIVAYDALADARDKWETLVVYSMLHVGDSDSTGCIAASWYGALYGFDKVPENNMKYLEYRKDLSKLGNDLYDKYYK